MGSLRALVLLASLAACDTSGLEIVVRPPGEGAPAPDTIRLFIGKADETPGSIAPEGFVGGEERSGYIWTRDTRDVDDVITDVGGASVSFGYVAEADHTEFGAIIAVGYTNGVPTSAGSLFHVKTGIGIVKVFDLPLYPAFDPRKEANQGKSVQIEIWGPRPGDENCVHLLNMHPDRDMVDPHDSAFIVTKGDRDCDSYPDEAEVECKADVHKTNALAEPDELECVLPVMGSGGNTFCVLGGPTCIDGQEQSKECSPSRFCAPPSVCSLCSTLPLERQQDCLRDPYAHRPGVTDMMGIKCHVASEIDTATTPAGPPKLCETTLVLPVPAPPGSPACSNATITTVGQPADDRLEVDSMRFEVDVTAGCNFELTGRGDVPVNFSYAALISGLVTVDRKDARSAALPIQIVVDPPGNDCVTTNAGCTVIFNEVQDRLIPCLIAPLPL